jgi:hypothetical protein
MTAIWNIGSENLSAARKLPPVSTRKVDAGYTLPSGGMSGIDALANWL